MKGSVPVSPLDVEEVLTSHIVVCRMRILKVNSHPFFLPC